MAPTFGYWDVRGLAEPIRYLLHYKNQDFEDKRYFFGTSDWQNDKFKLGLDFPNLPYYIDGKVRLTQSITILRYLARKFNLAGKTEEEKIRAELAEQQIVDFRTNLIRLAYNPDFDKLKEKFFQDVPLNLKQFALFLGDKNFLVGDSLTYVDFMAYDTFDFYMMLNPRFFDEFPNLREYQKRFERIPELQSYFHSSTYKRWPVFAPHAYFGGKGDEPSRE